LYLWEEDILNNIDLCEKLILLYINKKGLLDNYHSFNYYLDNEDLFLKKFLIKPYMDWSSKNLNKIINIKLKEKISKKQKDKWITFNCENCGKSTEQLISRYNKNNHHFCGCDCMHEYKKKQRIKNNCCYCGEELLLKPFQVKKFKKHFCNNECKINFNKVK